MLTTSTGSYHGDYACIALYVQGMALPKMHQRMRIICSDLVMTALVLVTIGSAGDIPVLMQPRVEI